ncbi:Non-histone chromosomal protein HMG-14 [Heterocephalus glaber]|uniref:Non-histone chromosomal protein HMG-14 n=1 Tax=Heterocephalus glaber TaxID=10181 RepID=G5C0M6_HETGA|nr:Non-histone chromosomal protein HMG-14 [Heterocephalus glaber]
MPRRKEGLLGPRSCKRGAQEETSKLAKPAPTKVDMKPAKDKSLDKKVQAKGKRGTKGKQKKVANQETKEDLPVENGETKNQENAASVEAEEKEAKSD